MRRDPTFMNTGISWGAWENAGIWVAAWKISLVSPAAHPGLCSGWFLGAAGDLDHCLDHQSMVSPQGLDSNSSSRFCNPSCLQLPTTSPFIVHIVCVGFLFVSKRYLTNTQRSFITRASIHSTQPWRKGCTSVGSFNVTLTAFLELESHFCPHFTDEEVRPQAMKCLAKMNTANKIRAGMIPRNSPYPPQLTTSQGGTKREAVSL